MTYILTDSLRPGMVVARKLTGNNNRVLLRAGVALSETHIRALRSLGIRGVEIRGAAPYVTRLPLRSANEPQLKPPVTKIERPQITRGERANGNKNPARPDSDSSQGQPATQTARRTEALANAVLQGTGVAPDSGLALVVRRCAIRIMRSRNSQYIDENGPP